MERIQALARCALSEVSRPAVHDDGGLLRTRRWNEWTLATSGSPGTGKPALFPSNSSCDTAAGGVAQPDGHRLVRAGCRRIVLVGHKISRLGRHFCRQPAGIVGALRARLLATAPTVQTGFFTLEPPSLDSPAKSPAERPRNPGRFQPSHFRQNV